jgi:hypothetical protein
MLGSEVTVGLLVSFSIGGKLVNKNQRGLETNENPVDIFGLKPCHAIYRSDQTTNLILET